MLPTFGDERRRPINLGGTTSTSSSHTAILEDARARRLERQNLKRRQEKAVKLQAWWRGIHEARATRQAMRNAFEHDIVGINGLRRLVLIGKDEEILGKWSIAITGAGEGMTYLSFVDFVDFSMQQSCFSLQQGPIEGVG
jgi:ubiquitin-protein ligase E3 C